MTHVLRILALLLGAFVGMVGSYSIGAPIACLWLWPQSNLCGLPVALFVAPLGAIAGAVIGWRLTRR